MDLAEGVIHALRGDAVLFTGAGFSWGATNSFPPPANNVPTARQFAAQLASELGSGNKSYDLPIISQYFSKQKGEHCLLNELSRRFTITSIQHFHSEIARIPWRRVYTTNYDNCFEFAALQSGRDWLPLTTDNPITGAPLRCIHINGYVANLNIMTLKSQIKLTHSSYSSDAFANSKWAQQLRQDLNNSKAAFFVGYSMSDLDIARILFSSPDLRSRTFFIIAPDDDDILISPLNDYGSVHKIGTEGLASIISNCPLPKEVVSEYEYSWLSEYDSDTQPVKPTDKDGIDVITLGVFNTRHVAWGLADPAANYFVVRNEIVDIQRELDRGRRWFLIHSDLGNGKTALKFQLSHILSRIGYRIFWDTDFDLNRKNDIRHLAHEDGKIAVFIDETPDRFEVIDGLLSLNTKNILCFVCVRTTLYELGQAKYDEYLPDDYLPVDLNYLSDSNVSDFVHLFNNLGLWGERAGLPDETKENFVKVECDRRISRLILSIFDNSELGNRIVSSARPIVNSRGTVGSFVVLCFILNRIGHPPKPGVLSEILNFDVWPVVKDPQFAQAGEFIRFRDGSIASRSSIISQYLLRRAVSPETLVWHVEQFVRRLASIRRDNVLHHIFTELQRFPVLESMIDSPRKRELIIGYFQAIKDIPFCQKSGLFWLHYAMARLAFGEFKEASHYFDHARSLAKHDPKDLAEINNHYARLLLDSRTKSDEYDDYFSAFEMAHGILIAQINRGANKHFPYKQARKYVEFISFRKQRLNPGQLKQFITACKQVESAIEHLTGSISTVPEVLECKKAMGRAITIANEGQT